MRILILSFYYPPDLGPGPLRAESLVNALILVFGEMVKIDILTTYPNRYPSYKMDALAEENFSQVSILRFRLPEHRNSFFRQIVAFALYAFAVRRSLNGRKWDIVIGTSSRLMTAVLSAWVAKQVCAKLYLDIRDLFTDTINNLCAKSPLIIFNYLFKFLERWAFLSADKINIVSAGFLPYIKKVSPSLCPTVFTNGIDEEFFFYDFSRVRGNRLPQVFYAGNMGDGQALHTIIPPVAEAFENLIEFKLLGDGGQRNMLLNLVRQGKLTNVQILDPVPRGEIFSHYSDADILFLHLNSYEAFLRVLPSKIFEYAATRKPILAGVSGYAAEFLRREVPGVEVFDPCDSAAMKSALLRLLHGPQLINRDQFCIKYLRKNIMHNMALDILELAKQ